MTKNIIRLENNKRSGAKVEEIDLDLFRVEFEKMLAALEDLDLDADKQIKLQKTISEVLNSVNSKDLQQLKNLLNSGGRELLQIAKQVSVPIVANLIESLI